MKAKKLLMGDHHYINLSDIKRFNHVIMATFGKSTRKIQYCFETEEWVARCPNDIKHNHRKTLRDLMESSEYKNIKVYDLMEDF